MKWKVMTYKKLVTSENEHEKMITLKTLRYIQ